MAENKDIKYLSRDFPQIKQNLQDFAKTYFPDTYNDFSPSSPGVMIMDMAAYVGDVLSFYLDNQIQETYLQNAKQTNNLFSLAYMMGYKPKATGVAQTDIDYYQVVPAILGQPDYNYALNISENSQVTSTSNSEITFLVRDNVDFSYSSSTDPTEVSVFQQSSTGTQQFLLKKTRKGISATVNTTTFTFNNPVPYTTKTLTGDNIIGILDIVDSEGNIWYEVDYLGQSTIFDKSPQTDSGVANILKLKEVQRRFVSRFLNPSLLQFQFGSGNSSTIDEEITPNPTNVGSGLTTSIDKLNTAFDPRNFTETNTYGISPSNTVLTVRYLTGGGVSSNIDAGDLITLSNSNIKFKNSLLTPSIANATFNSVGVYNTKAASGGKDGDTNEEIRQNSLKSFPTQLRNVTSDDYLIRSLSLPSEFGVISKAFIEESKLDGSIVGSNSLDLYILSYNIDKQLINPSLNVKNNLKTYLDKYRSLGDVINIKNAYVINFGVDFEIIIYPSYNSQKVLINCLQSLKDYFNIDKWQINQPLVISELRIILDKVEGVQTVKSINLPNKSEGIFSEWSYDMNGATRGGVVYPSKDPSIFELKFPDTDITGKVVNI